MNAINRDYQIGNTYKIDDTIYSKGSTHGAYNYFRYFINDHHDLKSILDIGCGNGIILKLLNKKINYLGVDSDAGIYKKKKNKKIKYFNNSKNCEKYLTNLDKKFDCVVLFEVLEHTDTFLKIFLIALKKSRKYVLVSLPNEDYLQSRIRFVFGKGLMTHGLDMVHTKPGHKHNWFIQYKEALKLLKETAKKKKFSFLQTMFYVTQPRNLIKRAIYKFFLLFLPKHIKSNGFCLVFCKNNSK